MYSSMFDKYSSIPPNRATNMKSMEALTRVMERSNQLEHFADRGLKTAPRDVRCGNCGGGHYHLTWSKRMQEVQSQALLWTPGLVCISKSVIIHSFLSILFCSQEEI